MLLLLDIDGVMVPAKGWKKPELLKDGFPAFSNNAIDALRKLIDQETTIVLTTSHKSNYALEEWKQIFKNRGIQVENMIALPKNIHSLNRREEIVNWLNDNHYFGRLAIIDDDTSLNDLPNYLKRHLLLTSPLVGLTTEHLESIREILSKHLEPA